MMATKDKQELFSEDLSKMMEDNDYYELCESVMINQDLKLIEELNELSSAIAKDMSINNGVLVGNDNILDEIADVIICIKGYIQRHHIPSSHIMSNIKYKLVRFKLAKSSNIWGEFIEETTYKTYMIALQDNYMDAKDRNKLLDLSESINTVYLITKWYDNVKKVITSKCFDPDALNNALANLEIIYKTTLTKIEGEL